MTRGWIIGEDLTLGVEEEFLLVDPATGALTALAPRILADLGGERGLKPELMRYQLETVTGICASVDEVRSQITRLRAIAAEAAESNGCLLIASGVAPGRLPGLNALTEDDRYARLAERYPPFVAAGGTCGHVHVGIPTRALGLQVITRLRPWLATLLAISANSPIAEYWDTTWASWRYHRWSQWPTAMPPLPWRRVADYDTAVRALIQAGKALDERSIYLYARLSPHYPTVEVRVMDTGLTVEDTVLLAALVRAMVAAALDDIRDHRPVPRMSNRHIEAALEAAAHFGLSAVAAVPARVSRTEPVATLLAQFARRGTGAERQRAMWREAATFPHFIGLLSEATASRAVAQPITGVRERRR